MRVPKPEIEEQFEPEIEFKGFSSLLEQTFPEVPEVAQPSRAKMLREELDENELKCDGCGVQLQFDESQRLGYIPRQKVAEYYKQKEELAIKAEERQIAAAGVVATNANDQDLIQHLKSIQAPQNVIDEFQRAQRADGGSRRAEVTDLNTLINLELMVDHHQENPASNNLFVDRAQQREIERTKRLVERKPDRSLICQRCHSLKNQNKLLEYDPSTEPTSPGKPVKLADHVASFNRAKIVREVFKQIYSRSIILYVIDITNFEGSQIEEIYQLANEKKCRVLVIVNKIDALPQEFKTRNL